MRIPVGIAEDEGMRLQADEGVRTSISFFVQLLKPFRYIFCFHHGSAPGDGRVVKELRVLPDRGFARFQPKLP